VVIIMPGREAEAGRLAEGLRRRLPSTAVGVWPEYGAADEVTAVVSWRHPPGVLEGFPALRMVASFGAGAEHLLEDAAVPAGVAVVRTVADGLARDLAEYVVAAVTRHRRRLREHERDQRRRRWRPRTYPARWTDLVLGMGRMGVVSARALAALGHEVLGWRRSVAAPVSGVNCLAGMPALADALPDADAVVCLLPLTPATGDLIDESFLARMKPGSLLVNVARGRHVVEDDLLDALDRGRPKHAVLDVVRTEPLPPEHPFWDHPGVTLTPHVAALTDPEAAADRIADNLRRLDAGEPLLDEVDRELGY
jgi:glyoxylate/hydroxypyruvate reductase A